MQRTGYLRLLIGPKRALCGSRAKVLMIFVVEGLDAANCMCAGRRRDSSNVGLEMSLTASLGEDFHSFFVSLSAFSTPSFPHGQHLVSIREEYLSNLYSAILTTTPPPRACQVFFSITAIGLLYANLSESVDVSRPAHAVLVPAGFFPNPEFPLESKRSGVAKLLPCKDRPWWDWGLPTCPSTLGPPSPRARCHWPIDSLGGYFRYGGTSVVAVLPDFTD